MFGNLEAIKEELENTNSLLNAVLEELRALRLQLATVLEERDRD